MKKSLRNIAATLFLACFAGFAWAYSPSEVLPEKVSKKLSESGTINVKRFKKESTDLLILPSSELSEKVSSMWKSKKNPVLIEENLYLVSKKDLNKSNPESATIAKSSEIIRSISKMEGMKYYSHSDKKWTTLYKDAFCLSAQNLKKRVPDNTAGSADGLVQYCLLNDNSLGKTKYKLEYSEKAKEVCVTFENITDVSVGPVTAVSEGNLHIGLLIIDCGDDLLIYSVVEAKFPSISFLEKKMNDSLSARMEAIYNWFKNQFKI